MKRLLFSFFFLLISTFCWPQISISPQDTILCPNDTLELSLEAPHTINDVSFINIEDAFSNVIDIGFPFVFYGQTQTQLVISSNNFVTFDLSLSNQIGYFQYNAALLNNQLDKVILFPFQDLSLTVNQTKIKYQVMGTAPFRKFVIEICEAALWGCNNLPYTTSQLILYETTNQIEMFIRSKPSNCTWWGGTAIQGLRYKVNNNLTYEHLVPGRDQMNQPWSASNDGIRFTPNGNTNYTITPINFAPVLMIEEPTPQQIHWFAAGNPNLLGTGFHFTTIAQPNYIPYYVAKVKSYVCGNNSQLTFYDTMWVHKEVVYDTLNVTTCDPSYNFRGNIYTQSGNYDTLIKNNSCADTSFHIILNLAAQTVNTLTHNFAGCDSVLFQNNYYTASTITWDTLLNQYGCDSIYIKNNIEVRPSHSNLIITAAICSGQSYLFNGINYTSSTQTTATFQNAFGCDSIVTLQLTVGAFVPKIFDTTICQGKQITFNGHTYSSPVALSQQITDTILGITGCDTIVTLQLQISSPVTSTLQKSICQGQSFTFNGITYTSPVTAAMNVKDTFQTSNGCDSVVKLILNVSSYITKTVTVTICQGDNYVFNGQSYSSSITSSMGIRDTFTTSAGCDSIVTLILNVLPFKTRTLSKTICEGMSYTFNGVTYTSPVTAAMGVKDTFTAAGGCDSIVTLVLNVTPPSIVQTIDTVLCQGNTYYHNGFPYTQNTTIYDTIQTSPNSCKSVKVTNVSFHLKFETTLKKSICQGDSFLFNNIYYSTPVTLGMNIKDTFQTANGCDSVVKLRLSILPRIHDTLNVTICHGSSYHFKGTNFTNSVTASMGVKDTFQNAAGCDSIVTFILNVNPPIQHILNATICPGQQYTFKGQTFTSAVSLSNGIKDTFVTTSGCDSIVSLVLNVEPHIFDTLELHLCQGDSFHFNGISYTSSVPLSMGITDTFPNIYGCDSIVFLNLSFHAIDTSDVYITLCDGDTYTADSLIISTAGIYYQHIQSIYACDSVLKLHVFIDTIVRTIIYEDVCDGTTYFFAGLYLNATGIYINKTTGSNGCDSVTELHFTIHPHVQNTDTITLCQGQTYNWGNMNLSTAGHHIQTFQTVFGCDSTVDLYLTFYPVSPISLTVDTICFGQTYHYQGQTFSQNTHFYDTLQNIHGCDSILELQLTILPTPINVYDTLTSCWTANYLGQTYNSSTTILDTFHFNSLGCDSAYRYRYLNVIPADTQNVFLNFEACNSFSFEGQTFTQSTQWVDTFSNIHSCDSLYRHVNIVIHNVNLVVKDTLIISCDSAFYKERTYFQDYTFSEVYQDQNGCDSFQRNVIIQVNPSYSDTLRVDLCVGSSFEYNGNSYNSDGLYFHQFHTEKSCDSTIMLQIQVHTYPEVTIGHGSKLGLQPFCVGDTVLFYGSGAHSYEWAINGSEEHFIGDTVKIPLGDLENTITLYGANQWGCVDSSSVLVQAKHCCDFFIPTAFSPNNDGINDVFKITVTESPYQFKLMIFNRLGQLVFKSFNSNVGWDGTINGEPAANGVYFYQFSGTCITGTEMYQKGDITLIR